MSILGVVRNEINVLDYLSKVCHHFILQYYLVLKGNEPAKFSSNSFTTFNIYAIYEFFENIYPMF